MLPSVHLCGKLHFFRLEINMPRVLHVQRALGFDPVHWTKIHPALDEKIVWGATGREFWRRCPQTVFGGGWGASGDALRPTLINGRCVYAKCAANPATYEAIGPCYLPPTALSTIVYICI
jgi:hypothetical protein